jgi:hypothetical protein
MNPKEEKTLRESIRHLIRHVKQKRLNEEEQLRSVIGAFFQDEISKLVERQVPDNEPTPNKSTGINVLEDLLKKIIPILEMDYKLLTTDPNQRKSFRAHIINAVVDTLTPARINTDAGDEEAEELDEEIKITVGDDAAGPEDDEKFIDIRTDSEISAEEEDDEDPRDGFGKGLEDEDETGRNMAYQTFKKLDTNILDSYELLSNPEDQELFYDYLIANLKLYFDKFEKELDPEVTEPTNQAYDMAKSDQGVEDAEMEETDLELEF